MLFDNCQSEIQRASQFGIDSRHHSACNPSGLPPSSWAAAWPPKWRPTPYGWAWATGPAERTWTSQWKTSKRLSRYWSRANKKPPWSHRQAWHTFKTYFIIFMQTMHNGSFFFFTILICICTKFLPVGIHSFISFKLWILMSQFSSNKIISCKPNQ